MSENHNGKPNYSDQQNNHEYNSRNNQYETAYSEHSYLPMNYNYHSNNTDDFYSDDKGSGAGSFLFGALVGGVIGAAAALFLTPKSGSEMRDDFSTQAVQLKEKSIEISSVAKDKASEFTAVAKEKTGELSKSLQEQSGQLVDKVKSMTSKVSLPMDDGTVSSEGEEAIEYIADKLSDASKTLEKGKDKVNAAVKTVGKEIEKEVKTKK